VSDSLETANAEKIGELIREMVSASGYSMREVSRRIGRTDNYLSAMLRNGSVPGVDLFARIAGVCGFVVYVSGFRTVYRIDSARQVRGGNAERVSVDDYDDVDTTSQDAAFGTMHHDELGGGVIRHHSDDGSIDFETETRRIELL